MNSMLPVPSLLAGVVYATYFLSGDGMPVSLMSNAVATIDDKRSNKQVFIEANVKVWHATLKALLRGERAVHGRCRHRLVG